MKMKLYEGVTYCLLIVAFTPVIAATWNDIQPPGSPPTNISVTTVSPTTLVVQWQEPVQAKDAIEETGMGYNVFYTMTPAFPISLWSVQKAKKSQCTVITNLNTSRVYTIRIRAFTSVGEGPFSDPINTRLEVPEQPRNLQAWAVGPSKIQLSWDPLEDSEIMSYRVSCNDLQGTHRPKVTISATQTRYLQTGLTPDTVYYFKVSAKFRSGEGVATPIVSVRTMDYTPGEPTRLRVKVYPTTILVSWEAPADDDKIAAIFAYDVHYWKLGENNTLLWPDIILSSGRGPYRARIKGLQPESTYEFTVNAFTMKGDGARCQPEQATTKPAVPSAPRAGRVKLLESDFPMLEINWSRPKVTYGELLGYRLEYGIWGTQAFKDIRFDANVYRYTTDYLEPGKPYWFSIAAKNHAGFGEGTIDTIHTPGLTRKFCRD